MAVRGRLGRVASVLLILVAALGAPLTKAQAAPYAAIVMDMRDGRVYHARSADRRVHPASLTKMMTLYLAFEAVERGQLKLSQRVRVSRHAARQPASKLYLKRGQRVTIRSLIRATAVKSANDAAMVLAEAIGGSQANFARMMTAKAKALGMKNSRFKNPHGLTQSGHISTARDMATLARRLYFDYPKYYNVFGRTKTRAAGKTIWTTNRLLRTYKGAEGMKTGYTRAAGYNLVSIAKRGQERVISVVMGGKSSRWRNARSKQLLDMGFRKAPTRVATIRPRTAKAPVVARAPLPIPRPGTRATGFAAISAALTGEAQAAVRKPVPSGIGTARAPKETAPPRPRPGSVLAAASERRKAAALRPAASAVPVARLAAGTTVAPGTWAVQVGAYRNRSAAEATFSRIGKMPGLSGATKRIERARSRGKPIFKARYIGLRRSAAKDVCQRMKKKGQDCMAIAPRR